MKFWNLIKAQNENQENEIRIAGPIERYPFWDDSSDPKTLRNQIQSCKGNITVWINSPGGDILAAVEMYNMLRDYKKGTVTVKIDALAGSAASFLAMCGDKVYISPGGMFMLHKPLTYIVGNAYDLEYEIKVLDEFEESVLNLYELHAKISREEIKNLMEKETWLSAKKAVEYGFADDILFMENKNDNKENTGIKNAEDWECFSQRCTDKSVLSLLYSAGNTTAKSEKHMASGKNAADKLILNINGKTPSGAMPYDLLFKQLQYLK